MLLKPRSQLFTILVILVAGGVSGCARCPEVASAPAPRVVSTRCSSLALRRVGSGDTVAVRCVVSLAGTVSGSGTTVTVSDTIWVNDP